MPESLTPEVNNLLETLSMISKDAIEIRGLIIEGIKIQLNKQEKTRGNN